MDNNENSIQIRHTEKNEPIYFLHIPKTAGMTLYSILEDHFDTTSIFPLIFWDDLLRLSPNVSNYELIRGHFGYLLNQFLPKSTKTITMLRDPVEQLISLFDLYKRNSPSDLLDFFLKNDNISDFLDNPYYRSRLQNMQTRYVGLDFDIREIIQKIKNKNEIQSYEVTTFNEFLFPSQSDDELLKIAKQHLNNFSFIGLVEKFQESLYLLCYTFGWRPIVNPVKFNVVPKNTSSKDLPKKTIDKIRECVHMDKKLYEYGVELFDQKFSLMVKDLKKKYYEPRLDDLSFSDMMQELLEKNYEDRFVESNIDIKSPMNFNFSQSFPHSGWYTRENYNGRGLFFRWSGPNVLSSIDIPKIVSNDFKIQIRVLMSIDYNLVENFELIINDNLIPLKISYQNKGRFILEGMAPKSTFSNERKFTRLIFKIPNTISPHSLDSQSPDKRKLGLAVDQIKFIPL